MTEDCLNRNCRSPEQRLSSVTISDAVNAFSELHFLDTPNSSSYDVSPRLASNPLGAQSRLNAETKKEHCFMQKNKRS